MPQSTLYGVFTASDGHLVIAAQVDDSWKRFAAQVGKDVGHATFASDTRFHSAQGRNEHRLEILPVVREWVSKRTVAQCLTALDAIDVPCAKVQRIDEVLADPQMKARGAIVEQDHPFVGKVRLPTLPLHFSDCDTTQKTPAPLMGQHNRDIAAKLGYSKGEIDTLVKEGVLYAEDAVGKLGL
jgi:crotonobetainyl-CoA:carnitine CoA-transferase CaiB-like acyl-CoA transferase